MIEIPVESSTLYPFESYFVIIWNVEEGRVTKELLTRDS